MRKLFTLGQYLRFYFAADTIYRVHSPQVFDFAQQVLEDDRQYYAFSLVEKLRTLLRSDARKIFVTDLGAGSRTLSNAQQRSIQQIARSALTSPYYCRLLFKIVNRYKPQTMIELGTSLGISALYHHFAALNAQLITMEGCPQVAAEAYKNFERLKVEDKIHIVVGDFAQTLPKVLAQTDSLDYVFFDGNHRKAPTLDYFRQCLLKAHEESIFIFDDIYWSSEMKEAWETVKAHPQVQTTIDLFFLGIVFFKPVQKKQHHKLVKRWMKPWMMGFFK